MAEVLVSIILPTYDRSATLGQAVKSVLEQSFSDFELIVVDDASQDNSSAVVNSIPDPRIKYIRRSRKGGAAAARNTGLREARGRYVAFQDSDDMWLRHKLQRQVEEIEKLEPCFALVYSDLWLIDSQERWFYYQSPPRTVAGKVDFATALRLELVGAGMVSALIRRQCFEELGVFDERFQCYEDLELFMRMSRRYSLWHMHEPLAVCRSSPDSLSDNEEAQVAALQLLHEKFRVDITTDPWLESKYCYWIGASLCRLGKYEEGRRYYWRSWRARPFGIQPLAAATFSILAGPWYARISAHRKKDGRC